VVISKTFSIDHGYSVCQPYYDVTCSRKAFCTQIYLKKNLVMRGSRLKLTFLKDLITYKFALHVSSESINEWSSITGFSFISESRVHVLGFSFYPHVIVWSCVGLEVSRCVYSLWFWFPFEDAQLLNVLTFLYEAGLTPYRVLKRFHLFVVKCKRWGWPCALLIIPRHEDVWLSGSIARLILNLGTTWR